MHADTLDQLRKKRLQLVAAFREHIEDVQRLQRQAIDELLADVVEQRGHSIKEEKWVLEYLEDEAAIFRTFMRHKYVKAFAYDALRATINWRLDFIHPISILPQPSHVLEFLPLDCLDFSDRPIAVLRARRVDVSLKWLVPFIMSSLETMRKNVCELNGSRRGRGALPAEPNEPHNPVLQYALVVDLEAAPATSLHYDTISWYLREVQPHFYAIIGTIYVINYGWAHKSVWRVAKQVLPASVNAKIVFCSSDDLPFLHSHTTTSAPSKEHSHHDSAKQDESAHVDHLRRIASQRPKGVTRRRQNWRDFWRMLLLLYWHRWKRRLGLGFLVGLFIVLSAHYIRRSRRR